MTFSQAIRTNILECLNFQGRVPRSAYWWYVLFIALGTIVCSPAWIRNMSDHFSGDRVLIWM